MNEGCLDDVRKAEDNSCAVKLINNIYIIQKFLTIWLSYYTHIITAYYDKDFLLHLVDAFYSLYFVFRVYELLLLSGKF